MFVLSADFSKFLSRIHPKINQLSFPEIARKGLNFLETFFSDYKSLVFFPSVKSTAKCSINLLAYLSPFFPFQLLHFDFWVLVECFMRLLDGESQSPLVCATTPLSSSFPVLVQSRFPFDFLIFPFDF